MSTIINNIPLADQLMQLELEALQERWNKSSKVKLSQPDYAQEVVNLELDMLYERWNQCRARAQANYPQEVSPEFETKLHLGITMRIAMHVCALRVHFQPMMGHPGFAPNFPSQPFPQEFAPNLPFDPSCMALMVQIESAKRKKLMRMRRLEQIR